MSRQVWTWIGQAALGATVGLVLAVAIGWWLWPRYANTTPGALRRDYVDDYLVMVASAYEVTGDLGLASDRLTQLGLQDPAGAVVDLAERIVVAGGSIEDITRLARLARDLGVVTPTLAQYVEGAP